MTGKINRSIKFTPPSLKYNLKASQDISSLIYYKRSSKADPESNPVFFNANATHPQDSKPFQRTFLLTGTAARYFTLLLIKKFN